MALVAGVNIPDNKRVEVSIQTVYGVGPSVAKRVVEEAALPGNPRVRELSEEELNRLRGALDRSGNERVPLRDKLPLATSCTNSSRHSLFRLRLRAG